MEIFSQNPNRNSTNHKGYPRSIGVSTEVFLGANVEFRDDTKLGSLNHQTLIFRYSWVLKMTICGDRLVPARLLRSSKITSLIRPSMMIAITRRMLASTDQGKMDIRRKASGGDFTRYIQISSQWKWHHVEQTWLRSRIMASMGVSRCCFPNLAGFCTQLRKHPKYPEVLYDLGLGLAGTPVNILEIKGI